MKHLFPVGEANGSHGVYRPGGASLNSGQVGSYRAALFISEKYSEKPDGKEIFFPKVKQQVSGKLTLANDFLGSERKASEVDYLGRIQRRMSSFGGIIRNKTKIETAVKDSNAEFKLLKGKLSAKSVGELADAFLLTDLSLTQCLYLEAIKVYIERGGRSRGSFLVTEKSGYHPVGIPEDDWNYTICRYDRDIEESILEIRYRDKSVESELVKVRPIPDQELWFEKVWKKNLEDKLTES